jgi:hypothetical protein
MKKPNKLFLILTLLSLTATITIGQIKIPNKVLAATIDSLYKADQACALIRPADSAAAAYQRVIRTNFPIVRLILNKYGFPGYDLVGKEGSANYFLLVQHSDFNIDFQKKALKLMKKQVDKKNASGSTYGYLVDRVNLNTGKKQIYGTQVQMSVNGTTLRPCIDTLHLDKRRKAIGLISIKDYLQQCDEAFRQMNPREIKKDN